MLYQLANQHSKSRTILMIHNSHALLVKSARERDKNQYKPQQMQETFWLMLVS